MIAELPPDLTCGVDRALAILHVSKSTLLRQVRAGIVPGSKPGRKWVFIEADLIKHIRENYKRPCCISASSLHFGGVDSKSMVENSASQLAQQIAAKRKNLRPTLVILPGGKQSLESDR